MIPDVLETAADRFLSIDGLRFHYRDVGDPAAPAVIVLHGIMGHAREWDTLVTALVASHRVIVVDQRGHGLTDWADEYTAAAMADDLIAVIERLNLSRPAVIGHSMGGIAAMVAAARRPELIARLVVVDIGPDTVSRDVAAEVAASVRVLGAASYANVDEAYAEWSANPLARPTLLRHYVEHCLRRRLDGRLAWRFDGRGLIALFDGVSERELWDAVDRIACPTLVVRGEHSPLLSPAAAEEMVARLGHAGVATIADGGHDLGVEQPEAVAAAVLEFLDG